MKVTLKKDTYNYFKDLLEDDGQRLIESWKEYIDDGTDCKFWYDIFTKVVNEVGSGSAQMVAKLLRGEIEIEEKKEPTRFVFYKKQGGKRRYYGAFEEVTTGIKATWYDTGLSFDEQHMKALEQLAWTKISLEQAIADDKNK